MRFPKYPAECSVEMSEGLLLNTQTTKLTFCKLNDTVEKHHVQNIEQFVNHDARSQSAQWHQIYKQNQEAMRCQIKCCYNLAIYMDAEI